MKNSLVFLLFFGLMQTAFSQAKDPGVITGTVLDESKKAVVGASVDLMLMNDSTRKISGSSDQDGSFTLTNIPFGLYRLRLSYVGLQTLYLDSISFRTERFDFNLNDLLMKSKQSEQLDEVIVYAEKPLIQSKDGNITFNAGESALAAGSNASDLLNNVPLVAKNSDGKITVRGKEPKILIDDKPVELNLQQLQDLLESMPGSSIEKIEVMTNPPPQYANEQGGVINIVTKKGKVGKSGRINISGGTRGEASINGSFNYRKKGLAITITGGAGLNRLKGNGYSTRQNIYTDSSNYFNTTNDFLNRNTRPNFRFNMDLDLNKNNILNFVASYNQNDYNNSSSTRYTNINRNGQLWKYSSRDITSTGHTYSPSLSLTYTWKGRPGETLRFISSYNFSANGGDRDFFQQYYDPLLNPTTDSVQEQLTDNRTNGQNIQLNYDRLLVKSKTNLSFGSGYNRSNNHVNVDASYKKKPEGNMLPLDLLSNDFWFHQTVNNYRASLRQLLGVQFSVTAGLNAEHTMIWFELLKDNRDVRNNYWTLLPFFNLNKTWKEKLSITMAYKRSIRRPGINELNPTIDFSDPYNIRFGNEKLTASTAHNFDLVFARNKSKYFLNLGMGFNKVEDIFSQVRTLLPDGKTQITWENISGRKEYEISSWNGFTISKKIKLNWSTSYTYNEYSAFDRSVRKFRNGGSFTSNVNSIFTPTDLWNITGSINFNRFANPQGYARWTSSMNLGVQRKFFHKKLTVTVNSIDPFVQQQNRNFTYGTNFTAESYSTTRTRNYRLSVAYNFNKTAKKPLLKTVRPK